MEDYYCDDSSPGRLRGAEARGELFDGGKKAKVQKSRDSILLNGLTFHPGQGGIITGNIKSIRKDALYKCSEELVP